MILGGSTLGLFIHAPSLFIAVIGGIAASFAGNSFQDIKNSLKGSFGGTFVSAEDAKKAVVVCSGLYNRFIAFGFLGVIIGHIMMLANLDDPDNLGPGMAVALLSLFYAFILALISYSFTTAARRQVNDFGEDIKPDLMVSPAALGLFCAGFALLAFSVLFVSF
ncbi:MotA/TolQ/ExbB proton channel family protein [candidate division KSB1 bacterium]